MIRFFALPPDVRTFFGKDRYLGDPLIDKCCREGTLPEELDEEPSAETWTFWGADKDEWEELRDRVILGANPHLALGQIRDWNNPWKHQVYLSFHPWRHFTGVLKAGSDSIFAAIYNFDNLIEHFDIRRTLTPRMLPILSDSLGMQLPPAAEPQV